MLAPEVIMSGALHGPTSDHPSMIDLYRFLAIVLEPVQAADIYTHLASCPGCMRAYNRAMTNLGSATAIRRGLREDRELTETLLRILVEADREDGGVR